MRDLAAAIGAHLTRFAADPAVAQKPWTDGKGETRELTLYWQPACWAAGSRIMVRYVAYQGERSLTRSSAEQYLAWLDAGGVGRHSSPRPPLVEEGLG